MFSLRGLRLYFPELEPWVVWSASIPHHSSGFICGRMWGRRVCQWSDCLPRSSHTPPVSVPPQQRESSPPQLPVSTPPTGLDECLFFYLLGIGLPCGSIFSQFWLCEEAQCVYLRRHLGSPVCWVLTAGRTSARQRGGRRGLRGGSSQVSLWCLGHTCIFDS